MLHLECGPRIEWVICGGESGPDARPMNPAWEVQIREQCEAARVPYFFKQWGAWCDADGALQAGWTFMHESGGKRFGKLNGRDGQPLFGGRSFETAFPYWEEGDPGPCMVKVGKERAGALLRGREHRQFPVQHLASA
jgi:hypothetical protein